MRLKLLLLGLAGELLHGIGDRGQSLLISIVHDGGEEPVIGAHCHIDVNIVITVRKDSAISDMNPLTTIQVKERQRTVL